MASVFKNRRLNVPKYKLTDSDYDGAGVRRLAADADKRGATCFEDEAGDVHVKLRDGTWSLWYAADPAMICPRRRVVQLN